MEVVHFWRGAEEAPGSDGHEPGGFGVWKPRAWGPHVHVFSDVPLLAPEEKPLTMRCAAGPVKVWLETVNDRDGHYLRPRAGKLVAIAVYELGHAAVVPGTLAVTYSGPIRPPTREDADKLELDLEQPPRPTSCGLCASTVKFAPDETPEAVLKGMHPVYPSQAIESSHPGLPAKWKTWLRWRGGEPWRDDA